MGMRTGKTYGTVSADRRKEMSGLEFVQGLADGTLPLNTIARTLGYDVTEAASPWTNSRPLISLRRSALTVP